MTIRCSPFTIHLQATSKIIGTLDAYLRWSLTFYLSSSRLIDIICPSSKQTRLTWMRKLGISISSSITSQFIVLPHLICYLFTLDEPDWTAYCVLPAPLIKMAIPPSNAISHPTPLSPFRALYIHLLQHSDMLPPFRWTPRDYVITCFRPLHSEVGSITNTVLERILFRGGSKIAYITELHDFCL